VTKYHLLKREDLESCMVVLKRIYPHVHGSVKENLPTCHADLETSSVDDITAENINRLVSIAVD